MTRIGDTKPPVSTTQTTTSAPVTKPTAPLDPSSIDPAPSLAVLKAIAALPPPEHNASDPEPLFALESQLGTPTGEKVGDAFAHTWIAELAARAAK